MKQEKRNGMGEKLSDVRCYYELIGDGEPLLLIPGLAATCRLWDPVTPLLSRHFSCIVVDNRGIGKLDRQKAAYLPVRLRV